MNAHRVITVGLLCVIAFVGPGIAITANNSCNTIDSAKVCIEDVSVPKDTLLVGAEANLSVTVKNTGAEPATVVVTLNTVGPNNTTGVYSIGKRTLVPGERQTITQLLNGSQPGTHGFQVLITDIETQKQFDVSEIGTIEVRSEPPVELGGPIDRSEMALGALIGSLGGLAMLGYRQRET